MSVAMRTGRHAALVFAGGVACGAFFWAVMATLGVSAILAAHPPFIIAIKMAGGCYFLWLAYKAARSAIRTTSPIQLDAHMPQPSGLRLYVRGLLLHLTNPKAVLIWMSIVAMGAHPADVTQPGLANAAPTQTWGVTAGCMLIGASVFASYALLFSTARARRVYEAGRRWLEAGLAIMFLLAAFTLLTLRA